MNFIPVALSIGLILLAVLTGCKENQIPNCPPEKVCPPQKPCPPEKPCPPCPECKPTSKSAANMVGEFHLSMKPMSEDLLKATFAKVQEAMSESKDIVLTLINGQVADPKKFSGVVWIGNCTATVIGPQTLITAAHCTRSKVSFSVSGHKYSGQCMAAPEYSGNSTADYSICHITEKVEGIEYEVINVDPDFIATNDKILQSGFGCTKWGKQLDGKFRIGEASVLRTPVGNDFDYRTGRGEDGEAVLCSGDSGGPAWGLDSNKERTKLISVNSRSNTTTRSYLSALATSSFTKLLANYQKKYQASVCGIDGFDVGCRGVVPKPKPFALQAEKAYIAGHINKEYAAKADKIIEAVAKAIED